MPVYIFTCPICKQQYKLTPNDPTTLAQKNFSCPKCRYTAPFTSVIKDLPIPQPITRSDGPVAASVSQGMHSATKVAPGIGMQSKAYISVIGNNARYVLSQGVYVLGRKSSDSTASLQLAQDISMSRQHARLAVQTVGGKLMAQIVGLKANNPIFVNGKMYAAGQPYTLKSGDRIQLGMTRIVFSL